MPCPHNEITIVQRSQRQSAVAAPAGELTLPASILIFLLIFLLFYKGVGSVSQTASEQQMENLQQAIRRSTVHCYAVEGSYPESLDYLKEHYGITYDPEKYIVDYEIIGSNLMPDVKVFARK